MTCLGLDQTPICRASVTFWQLTIDANDPEGNELCQLTGTFGPATIGAHQLRVQS